MDPQRRLQVLNQSNPSLRVSVAPTQQLRVSTAAPQDLRVGNTIVQNTTSTTPDTPERGGFGQFLGGVGTQGVGGIIRDVVKTPTLLHFLKPIVPHSLDHYLDTASEASSNFADNQFSNANIARTLGEQDPSQTQMGRAGEKVGGIVKGVGDVAGAVAGGAELASKAPSIFRSVKNLFTGAKDIESAVKAGDLAKLADVVSKENSVKRISKGLNVSDDVAKYLAGEQKPESIQAVLESLSSGNQAAGDTLKVFNASHPDPASIPEGFHAPGEPDPNAILNEKNRAAKAAEASKGKVYETASGVKSKVDPELVKAGLVDGKISEAKIADMIPGSDTIGPVDNKTVAQYIDDLSKGKPIEPVIVERGPNGELIVQDGKHRLAALQSLGIEDAPITEKVTPKMLPGTASGPIAGDGFTMADKSNPELAKVSGQIQKIDKKLEAFAQGKSSLSGEEALALSQERESLITKAKVAGSGTADVTATATTPTPVATVAKPGELGKTVNKAADTAAAAATDAKVAFPNADPEAQKAIQEVMDKLGEAQGSYNTAAAARTTEKGQRVAAGTGAFDTAGGGEAGMQAKLGALKGKYTESGFNPISATPETQTAILNNIEGSDLTPFKKLNTQQAIRKIWGTVDGKPTPADIRYIREYFGDGFANTVEEAVKAGGTSWRDKLAIAAATPKAAMATADLSAPLRQGAVLGTRFPKQFAENAAEAVKFFSSQDAYDAAMAGIRSRPNYELMQKAKLAVDGAEGVVGTEEQFMSSLLESKAAKKLLVGQVTAASDRGYTGFLTKFRADVFDKIIEDTKNGGVVLDDKALRSLGEFINSASGRGNLGSLEKHSGLLSKALFSPRLWKSRLDLLNPAYYAKLSGPARAYALQSSASFAAVAGTVLMLAQQAGAHVVWDPRSADFAKIKIGNTRYDILGGLQQNIRLGAQLVTGKKINSETGQIADLGPKRGFGKPSRLDILEQFVQNKENPLLGYATKLLQGDQQGVPINPVTEAGKLFIPLSIQDTYDVVKDRGTPQSAALAAPGLFGVGVQTYGKTPTKDQGPNGKPPVKSLADQITADASTGKTSVDEFKSSLSKDDQALLGANATERKALLDKGTITQDQFDRASAYDQVIKNMKGDNNPPAGAKSSVAKAFFKKFNSLTSDGQKAFLAGSPDATAKEIAKHVNSERAAGLSEFKPSNELSKAYAQYEDDINSHPEYSTVDKRNKAKAFQVFSYKLNYSPPQRDIYSEGPSSDLHTLIDNGQISKEDLDAAINMDNELYTSGLTNSLKFSKKFRNEFGYGIPSGEGGPNAGKTGGSSTTHRAYLADLLPSSPKSGSSGVPQFSARSRGVKFKTPVTLGGGSGGKKVSIKL